MKYVKLIILCVLLSSLSYNCIAGDVSSAQLSYEQLNDSTYRVFYKLFVFCQAIPVPNTFDICVYNSCTNQSFTATLSKWNGAVSAGNNGDEVKYSCGTSRCTDANSTVLGIREWWYYKDIVLPVKCNAWKFKATISSRMFTASNIVNPSSIYTEATLNNTITSHNNSAVFTVPPIYVATASSYNIINRGAIDPDGDSLVVTSIQPLAANSCSASPGAVSFRTTTPPLNTTTNPFPCSNTFAMNQQSGAVSFTTPNQKLIVWLTFKTDEYRNNVLVGSTIHDAFLTNINVATPSPSFNIVTSSISGASWNNNTLQACIGTPVQMCFYLKSVNSASLLHVSDNMAQQFPGATVTYTGNGDSVRGCISWTPGFNDVGKKYVYVSVRDTQCTADAEYMHSNHAFTVYVAPKVKVSEDTTICSGEKAQLNASGGLGNYTWSILSGTPNSLSCTTCTSPLAGPVTASTYIAVANNSICPGNPNYRDTVTVNIHTGATSHPTLNVTVSPGSVVAKDSVVLFTAAYQDCSQPAFRWLKNGSVIPGETGSTYLTNSLKDGDVISCEFSCNDLCSDPRKQNSNGIRMTILSGINDLSDKGDIHIVPNPNSGEFMLSIDHLSQPVTVEVFDIVGHCVYRSEMKEQEHRVQMNTTPGLYTIRILGDSKVYTGNVLIQ